MVNIRFLGTIPTDAESEDILDADHDPEAMTRLIKSAIAYMERGDPVPSSYVHHLKVRLLNEHMPPGAPRKASLTRVAEMIEDLIHTAGLSKTKARARAAEAFGLRLSAATNYHREYVEAKRGCSAEEYAERLAEDAATEVQTARKKPI